MYNRRILMGLRGTVINAIRRPMMMTIVTVRTAMTNCRYLQKVTSPTAATDGKSNTRELVESVLEEQPVASRNEFNRVRFLVDDEFHKSESKQPHVLDGKGRGGSTVETAAVVIISSESAVEVTFQ